MIRKYAILLLVGKDRPGIVDDVASFLFQHGANLEDSRMAAMGGCFSIMILFSCGQDQYEPLRGGLAELRAMGFDAFVHEAEDPEAAPRLAHLPLRLEITAMDHPGIVRQVVRLLRGHGVNIESLSTEVSHAPLSGGPLFGLNLEAGVPADRSIARIKKELEALAEEMNLDLRFVR